MSELEKDTLVEGGVVEECENPQTVCRDCCFAEYDDKTQTGCTIGKIDLLKENGAEIIEAYDETEKEFFVVDGRVCVFWREPEWKNQEHVKKMGMEAAANLEVSTRFAAVIYMDKDTVIEDVFTTVDSLTKQNPAPYGLYFSNNSSIKPSKLANIGSHFTTLANNQSRRQGVLDYNFCASRSWKIDQIKEENVDMLRCLDITLQNISANQYNYYFVFKAGYKIPKLFTSSISSLINDKMERFLALVPEGENVLVAQVHMHKSIGGNSKKPFVDKIKNVCKEQKCEHLVKNLSEVIQLPQE